MDICITVSFNQFIKLCEPTSSLLQVAKHLIYSYKIECSILQCVNPEGSENYSNSETFKY